MKKSLLTTVAALLFAAPALLGQVDGRIDIPAMEKRIAKSDKDIADPKKNTKGATWLARGDVFFEAGKLPFKGLSKDMARGAMDNAFPQEPTPADPVKVGNVQYNVNEYDRFWAYMTDGKLKYWTENKVIIAPQAFEKAAEAYAKAAELDEKSIPKAYDGMNQVVSAVKDRARTYLALQQYEKAAVEYKRSYDIQLMPPVEKVDTADLFFASMASTVAKDFDSAIGLLKEQYDMGYYHKGDVLYYMYHCYVGEDDKEAARKILLDGATKFPDQERFSSPLPILYANNTEADISEIESIINKALKNNPKDVDMIYGVAVAYMRRDMNDKALEYFEKATELNPEEYSYAFNTGYLYIQQADLRIRELREVEDNLSNDEIRAAGKDIEAIYEKALPYFERAHAAKPQDQSAVRLMRSITDRLQGNSDEMKAKFEEYDALMKSLESGGAQ